MKKWLGVRKIPTVKELVNMRAIEPVVSFKEKDSKWRELKLKEEIKSWKKSYDRLYGRYIRLLKLAKRNGLI